VLLGAVLHVRHTEEPMAVKRRVFTGNMGSNRAKYNWPLFNKQKELCPESAKHGRAPERNHD